jgi:hypothetical protein
MRTANKRAAKRVAAERADLPRSKKVLVVAYHEDEKGKPLKNDAGEPIVALRRVYQVAPYSKTCLFYDSQCTEHRFELEEGELDFTSGLVTVKEEEYDEEGNFLASHNLSHEVQYMPNFKQSNMKGGEIAFTRKLQSSPNACKSRFNPHVAKRAGIILAWQAQADSPDATWIDGRKPTEEEVAQAQAAYEERKAERQRGRATTSPTQKQPAGGPDPVHDEEGETFDDDFNGVK